MTRSQARPRMRIAWGWRLPRGRASGYSLAAQGEPCRALSAKTCRAWRALRLAAMRNRTLLVLPEVRVTGVAPASAAAWSALLARSRIGPSSASSGAGGGARAGAGLGGGLVGAGGAVKDRAELGQQLGEADLAGVGQGGEQPCLG